VRCGSLRQGKAVAARMLWVGLDVVRQEVCSGLVRLGMKRSVKGQAGICRGLVRLGHIRCGSQGTAPDILEGLGNEWSGRNLQRRGGVVTHVECLGSRGV
jgi:hypothetical protein